MHNFSMSLLAQYPIADWQMRACVLIWLLHKKTIAVFYGDILIKIKASDLLSGPPEIT